MNLDKNALLDLLHDNGQHAEADQAAAQLPDQVDTEQHAGLLSKLGINLPSLLAKFTGGGNGGGSGLAGMLGGLTGGSNGGGAGGVGSLLGGLTGGAAQQAASPVGDEQGESSDANGEPDTGGGLSGLLGRP